MSAVKSHPLFQSAWQSKSSGKPAAALRQFQELLDQEASRLSLRESIEVRRQMAVCLRLMMRLRAADKIFQEVYEQALRLEDITLARLIVMDWSAVLLDRYRPNKAIALLESILALEMSGLEYAQVQGYLGRAYGHKLARTSREKALVQLSAAADDLQGQKEYIDLRLDMLAWMCEVRLLRGRENYCRYGLHYALQFAKMYRPARAVDLYVRRVGGVSLHRLLRYGVGIAYRFQK